MNWWTLSRLWTRIQVWYIWSRLQRVRLQRAPVYNRQIYLHENYDYNGKKVRLQRAPTYTEQFLLHLFTRCKQDPMYVMYSIADLHRKNYPMNQFFRTFWRHSLHIKIRNGIKLNKMLCARLCSWQQILHIAESASGFATIAPTNQDFGSTNSITDILQNANLSDSRSVVQYHKHNTELNDYWFQ